MKSAYKYLALAIALDVLLQAAAIAYAVSGLASYVDDGHQVAKGTLEDAHFNGVGGYALHAVNGMVVIPVLGDRAAGGGTGVQDPWRCPSGAASC